LIYPEPDTLFRRDLHQPHRQGRGAAVVHAHDVLANVDERNCFTRRHAIAVEPAGYS
jgi:hypothetical protein